jgi:hypothetical protein
MEKGIIELQPDRNDGARTAAILAAYLNAEHAHAFRRLLWRRLAVLAIAAIALEAITRIASASGVVICGALFCCTGSVGPLIEWRAEQRLARLLDRK